MQDPRDPRSRGVHLNIYRKKSFKGFSGDAFPITKISRGRKSGRKKINEQGFCLDAIAKNDSSMFCSRQAHLLELVHI